MSPKRQFTVQEDLERISNQDAETEEVVSKSEDSSEPEDDRAEDPDAPEMNRIHRMNLPQPILHQMDTLDHSNHQEEWGHGT